MLNAIFTADGSDASSSSCLARVRMWLYSALQSSVFSLTKVCSSLSSRSPLLALKRSACMRRSISHRAPASMSSDVLPLCGPPKNTLSANSFTRRALWANPAASVAAESGAAKSGAAKSGAAESGAAESGAKATSGCMCNVSSLCESRKTMCT